MKNILESGPAASVEAAREEPAAGTEEQREQPDFQSFESIEKMQESEEILSRCVSEISGVEILKGKNGGIYLVSEKKRILPRHTLVGGYGAGKFLGLFYCFMSFQTIFCHLGFAAKQQVHVNFDFNMPLPGTFPLTPIFHRKSRANR